MTKKFREGSMGAADEKASRRFLIVATIIVLVIMSMVFIGFPKTYLHDPWYKRSGTVAHIFSFISFLGCIAFMWFGKDWTWGERGGKEYGIISGLLLVLGIILSAGFNFSL